MTDAPDAAIAAIGDARALLAALLAGNWRELHVAAGASEIFIGLVGAGPNPMRATAPATVEAQNGRRITVKAPHVATLLAVAAEGSRVAQGGIVATLGVLDEEIAVLAPGNFAVDATDVAVGALLEFGQTILRLREVA